LRVAEYEGAQNDACLDSIVLSPSDDDIVVVVSTIGSTPDIIPVCSSALPDAPGTWYHIKGNGKVISISTCSLSTKVATAISVFSGSCEDLTCLSEGVLDYACQDVVASSAIFPTEEGNTYLVLLQSLDGIGGNVGLTVNAFEGAEN
jgi:hypothetical protein